MDFDLAEAQAYLLNSNIDKALHAIGRPETSRELIVEALTSAHRDLYEQYESNGNREHSAIGIMALARCIKYGNSKDEFKPHVPKWRKLQTHQGVVTIAINANLNRCIASSIRQNYSLATPKPSKPLSKKVIAYAIWGLIGAVYADSDRNLQATCYTLNALCQYLEPQTLSNINTETPPSGGILPESNFTFDMMADDFCFDFDLPMDLDGLDVDSSTSSTGGVLLSDSPLTSLTWGSTDLPLSPGSSQLLSQDSLSSPETDSLVSALSGMSLAHTSVGGEQAFFLAKPQPIGPLKKTPAKTKPQKGRSGVSQKIDEYIKAQRRYGQALISDGNRQLLPTLDFDVDMPSNSEIHKRTMRRIFHGSVSAFAVTNIKKALAARRSSEQSDAETASATVTESVYFYTMVNKRANSKVKNNVEMYYYIYMLYLSLRGEYKTAHDERFVHNDQHTIAATSRSRTGPGNPHTMTLSKEYEKMIYDAEPDFDYKLEDEQLRLRADLHRLRKLGERFHKFVSKFGIGVLCLLPFGDVDQHVLAMSELDFINLPVTVEKELDKLIQLHLWPHHPIANFAHAAEPILDYIVNKDRSCNQRFCCEETDIAGIMELVEGSQELLAQLLVLPGSASE